MLAGACDRTVDQLEGLRRASRQRPEDREPHARLGLASVAVVRRRVGAVALRQSRRGEPLRGAKKIEFSTRRSSARATPRGLFGGRGEMIAQSLSGRPNRVAPRLPPFGSLEPIKPARHTPCGCRHGAAPRHPEPARPAGSRRSPTAIPRACRSWPGVGPAQPRRHATAAAHLASARGWRPRTATGRPPRRSQACAAAAWSGLSV